MKYRIILPLVVAAALSSCQRSADNQAKAEEDRAAVQAAADALDAERAHVKAEREALEAEKEELRMQREAELAAKEEALRERELGLELQSEEARLAAEALAAEQEALALREQELNAVELAQAGTTVIADWTPDEPEVVQEPVADYSLFYDELEPYGSWFETPDYGYVYQPTVVIQNRSWRPYTYGKWVCSNLGWTWRSDEPFGWATFHYGRWTLLSGRGWCWVPGSEWAPSWCAWREGGGHVGWAPLPPETLAYRGRGWGANVDVELGIASSCFNFVESRYMANSLFNHCLPLSRNAAFIRSTRGCTNIQFQQNRIIAGGPSYADIYQRVNKPWPVCHLDLNATGGIGHGRGVKDFRHGVQRGNQLQLFAPSIDAPWNSRLRPNHVKESWKNVEVVRAESGLQQTWSRRLAEARERQEENARRWAQKNNDLKAAREQQLQANREKVAAAQARMRENIARNISLRQQKIDGTPRQPEGPVANIPDRRAGGGVASVPDRSGPRGGASAGDTPERNGPRNGETTATVPDRSGPRGGESLTPGRDGGRGSLPPGVTRPGEPQQPNAVVPPTRTPEKTSSAADDRLAEIRRKQEEARNKVAQRNEEIRAKFEEARNARSQPKPDESNGNAAAAPMQERAAQAQQQQAQEAAQKAAQQAQAKADLQERLRQQQEANRAKQEQAKMEIQRKVQEQQERVRAAQEQAKQAQAERARQQAEEAQQREMANRQAAEQAAREKQAAAQRAAEQRAQQQAEMARRQEEAQRAAQEKAQQQQERAREAAEQRARQQQENQERLRQAQEQMREKIREQQEKRQNR